MPQADHTGEHFIFDEPFLKIGHHPGHALLHLVWSGYAPSKDYRRGLDRALEFVLENQVVRWLADLRNMGAILQDDEKWTNTIWFPQLANSTLEKMAILRSADYFNDSSVDRIMSSASEVVGFEVGYFRNQQEAMEWLLA